MPGDIIILHLCTKNRDDIIYSPWDIECDRLKLVIMGYFLPCPPPKNPKNQNFEQMKKIAGNVTILHHNHNSVPKTTIGGPVPEIRSEADIIFCHFGPHFCSFTLLTTRKVKILKKWKKHLEMSSFYTGAPKNHDHMMYASSDMECDRHDFLSFWVIFCPFTPLLTPKIKIWKKF